MKSFVSDSLPVHLDLILPGAEAVLLEAFDVLPGDDVFLFSFAIG